MSNNGRTFQENLSILANNDGAQSRSSDGVYYILVKWANVLSGKQTQGLPEYNLWITIAFYKFGKLLNCYSLYQIIKYISNSITGIKSGGSQYDLISDASSISSGSASTYLRPDGVSTYLRPDGVSTYLRP